MKCILLGTRVRSDQYGGHNTGTSRQDVLKTQPCLPRSVKYNLLTNGISNVNPSPTPHPHMDEQLSREWATQRESLREICKAAACLGFRMWDRGLAGTLHSSASPTVTGFKYFFFCSNTGGLVSHWSARVLICWGSKHNLSTQVGDDEVSRCSRLPVTSSLCTARVKRPQVIASQHKPATHCSLFRLCIHSPAKH